ncbi:efflux transporter outer membrane subunit [Diaphorobacter ruginosibacter]|uniref:efflux transporter outer membrane subunit n=1 Tax=Diaphorobacter ruginosibacter TaxID=1715720 RepID=UPI003340E67C
MRNPKFTPGTGSGKQAVSLRAALWPCVALAGCLAGCAAGPDYVRPPAPDQADSQTAFKEDGPWRQAMPAAPDDAQPWWHAYGDEQLDALVGQAMAANQTLAQAQAQYRAAQALVRGAQAAYSPVVQAGASAQRARAYSSGKSSLGDAHAWSLSASWEPDFWGSVSRSVEAAGDTAQATAADLAAARLAVQASVVNDYLQLRITDRQKALYARTIEAYRKSLDLTQAQFRAGVATHADVSLAESTLAATQAQAIDVNLTRRQTEHALAILLGRTPAGFSLAPDDASALPALPGAPIGLPSQLLERRPDIAGAERRVAAANAQIGVAQAAFYPHFTLSASGGNGGPGLALASWAAAPTKAWALGLALAGTIFDGGARDADLEHARADFDAAAATYRQTVLDGFQEVEDNLAAVRELRQEFDANLRATQSARAAERITLSQYRAGTVTYMNVITAQALALTNERSALQAQGRAYAASVALIKAVGGGWSAAQLPQGAQADRSAGEVAVSDSKDEHHEQQ